ncbi:MAG: ATP-binding protein [Thermomicrobiales bacterium]
MKHIGDVIKHISIPISTNTAGTSNAPAAARCPVCQDAGYLRVDVPIGHPNFGRIFPCECKVREREDKLIEDLRRLSNLDAFAERTFDSFDHTVEGVAPAYAAAVQYARNPHGWLFLHGNCGSGKTHLAVSVALHAMRRQKMSVLFAVVPDLLDHLRATFDPAAGVAYDDRFSAVRNAQLLILDDLGTENTTPWAREKLYQIFNHRYNEQLPTVVTSNQDFKRIEERVLSRLLDTRLTTFIHVDAGDFRRRQVPRQDAGDR